MKFNKAVARPRIQEDLSMYDWPYRLREEAYESWENAIIDELVYIADVAGAKDDASRRITEAYLKGDIWVEVEFCFVGQRNTKYSCIVQSLESYRPISTGKMEFQFATISGDSPVLVEATHSVQPPKKVVFNGCRSICWLKLSDNGDSTIWNTRELRSESASAVAVPFLDNRELDPDIGNRDCQFSQPPNKLVEGCTHAIEGIPAPQGDMVGDFIDLNPESVPLIFKVFLTEKSAGVRLMEGFQIGVESIQVTLRPIQLQIGVSQIHDAP